MKLTQELIAFIEQHSRADTTRLLLDAARYPEIDIPFAVDQIIARRQIRDKLPAWHANKALAFPSKIAAEQCSSELTARYKQQLIGSSDHLCDLTGGLGVDSYYFSLKARKVTYVERFKHYAEAARENYRLLGADDKITVINGNGEELAKEIPAVDVFYLDPARRSDGNKRVFALADCEPDLVALHPVLLRHAPKLIAKISPMADITQTLALLPPTNAVHVLSVRNECKELLFVMHRHRQEQPIQIVCVNFLADGRMERFAFSPEEERSLIPVLAPAVGEYLYEPNASLLKAGAFRVITAAYPVAKLDTNSHLYTSDAPVAGFPGRTFRVEEVIPFSSALCKRIAKGLPKANITVRNFPLTVESLRRKTGISEGGETYLFATTLANGDRVFIRTRKMPAGN